MRKMGRTLLSLLLALVMLLQLAPTQAVQAWAEDGTEAGKEETLAGSPDSTARWDYTAEDVLFELGERRDEDEKHFRMADGSTLAVVYGRPVHYLTEDGGYQEIDNRLALYNADGSRSTEEQEAMLAAWQEGAAARQGAEALKAADGMVFRNNGGMVNASFSVLGSSSQLVRIAYEGKAVGMTPKIPTAQDGKEGLALPAVGRIDNPEKAAEEDDSLSAAILPKHSRSSLTYKGLFETADLQYVLTETELKENIVIHDRADSYVYSFLLETEGLTPRMAEDGGVDLLDENDACIMRIPAGYMADAEGAYSDDVRYELQESGGQVYLTVTADPAWINDEARRFPITVDPTITVMWNSGLEMSTICSGRPNASHYDVPFPDPRSDHRRNALGYVGRSQNEAEKLRTLVRVNSLPTLPPNSIVENSQLRINSLRYIYRSDLLPMTLYAYALTENEEQNGLWCKYHCWNDCWDDLSDYVLDFSPVRNETEEI